jgi:hypothetical protein
MSALNQVPRAQKRDIAQKLRDNLVTRTSAGPAEPALDTYISELETLIQALTAPITGNLLADAQRTARLARLDAVDVEVDTCYRHVESFLDIESRRRAGANTVSALALHKAAFPDGLAHVDDSIADENRACRDSLTVLRSPEYALTVAAIQLPIEWLDRWESWLAQSEGIHGEIEQARTARRGHVSAGQDAEADFVEMAVRLRRYVASRAKSSDKPRVAEGKALLAPLLDEVARLRAAAATRATIRENEKNAPAPAPAPAPSTTP